MTKFSTGDHDSSSHVGDDYFLTSGDKIRFFFEEGWFRLFLCTSTVAREQITSTDGPLNPAHSSKRVAPALKQTAEYSFYNRCILPKRYPLQTQRARYQQARALSPRTLAAISRRHILSPTQIDSKIDRLRRPKSSTKYGNLQAARDWRSSPTASRQHISLHQPAKCGGFLDST